MGKLLKRLLKKLLASVTREVIKEIVKERIKVAKAFEKTDIWDDNPKYSLESGHSALGTMPKDRY